MIRAWSNFQNRFRNSHLLLGNGFSINVSKKFRYSKLKEASEFPRSIRALFKLRGVETDNFEEVLSKLATAKEALTLLDGSAHSKKQLQFAYDGIKEGLYTALSAVHCSKQEFLSSNTDKIPDIRNHLLTYRSIFTTNYDLILAWIILSEAQGDGFTDCFYGPLFDLEDTEIWGGKTPVYYLHGALFLSSNPSKETRKHSNTAGFYSEISKIKEKIISIDNYPLIVTEGDWMDKVRSIRGNDYLDFCFSKLSRSTGRFVIFGQSLDESYDKHILNALNKPGREIAISIHAGRKSENRINFEKEEYKQKLDQADISFFRSETHPLSELEGVIDE